MIYSIVAHADALNMMKNEINKHFLINQRKKGLPGYMYGIDNKNMQKSNFLWNEEIKHLQEKSKGFKPKVISNVNLYICILFCNYYYKFSLQIFFVENLMEIDESPSDLEIDESASDSEIDESSSSVETDFRPTPIKR